MSNILTIFDTINKYVESFNICLNALNHKYSARFTSQNKPGKSRTFKSSDKSKPAFGRVKGILSNLARPTASYQYSGVAGKQRQFCYRKHCNYPG